MSISGSAWRTFLQQYDSSESIVQVPEVGAPYSAFVIQLSIYIKPFVCSFLKLPHTLTRHGAIVDRRVELIAPRRAVAVAVSVVVTKEIISPGFLASADLEGLIDGRKEVFGQIRNECGDAIEVQGSVAG